MNDARRALPAVHALLDDVAFAPILETAPRSVVTSSIRAVIERVRAGDCAPPESTSAWAALVTESLGNAERRSMRRVLNATGVVLHTNLGRAPLAHAAVTAMVEVAAGYANVEYDLATGRRGARMERARDLLCELTGAEDAMVVNNCAAALLLALRALAHRKDVLVSRGELVEIGGSFRIPDIMAQADVRLVEVGTTNRTHLDDYRRAINPVTGAIVKVHRSNFTMNGFVAEAGVRELAAIAEEAGIPLVHDFGSGLMVDLLPWGLSGEPVARDAIAAGVSVVLMSSDKLLGGPQGGIAIGRRDAIAQMRAHPFARAVRVDKLTLAALEATLGLYRDTDEAVRTVPVLAMITASQAEVRARASAVSTQLSAAGVVNDVVDSDGAVGGGAYPGARLPSAALRLAGDGSRWERALRSANPPVIGRVADDAMLLDMRTMLHEDDTMLATVVAGCAPK
jgi:L-seryl-tRNA(Ser) seleniumtransferase